MPTFNQRKGTEVKVVSSVSLTCWLLARFLIAGFSHREQRRGQLERPAQGRLQPDRAPERRAQKVPLRTIVLGQVRLDRPQDARVARPVGEEAAGRRA